MASRKANEAQFYLICGDLDEKTFEVADFSGVENISLPYRFDITLLSVKPDVQPEEIIGKPTTLYIYRNDLQLRRRDAVPGVQKNLAA